MRTNLSPDRLVVFSCVMENKAGEEVQGVILQVEGEYYANENAGKGTNAPSMPADIHVILDLSTASSLVQLLQRTLIETTEKGTPT